MVRRIAILILSAALCGGAAFADGELAVDALVAAGTQGNLDLQKARRTLADAEKNLPWQSELTNTKASLSGSYDTAGRFSGQAQAAVPIIPQVSLGASVTAGVQGGIGSLGSVGASLDLTPFAAWQTRFQEKAAYRNAKAQLDYQTAKTAFDIQSAAYGLLQSAANVTVARAKLVLQEQRADIAQKTYDIGELTYDDYQTAQSNLIAARQSGFDAERGVLNARVQLYRLLGPANGEPAVKDVSTDDLTALIAARSGEISKKDAAKMASLALRQAEISLDSLKEQLAATPLYRPSLGLSAQVTYNAAAPSGSALSGSGSVSFSFSPSEIKTDDRATLVASIADAQHQVQLELLALKLQTGILSQALAVAQQVLDARRGELRQAEATLVSTRLLLEQGQRTTLDVEDARIAVEAAKLRLAQAATGVLDAQAQILLSSVL
jgi:outer membrane protein TolC